MGMYMANYELNTNIQTPGLSTRGVGNMYKYTHTE